jgi:hypothetical protein
MGEWITVYNIRVYILPSLFSGFSAELTRTNGNPVVRGDGKGTHRTTLFLGIQIRDLALQVGGVSDETVK